MPDSIARAILETLHYADLFDYPLTAQQLQRFLIGVRASRAEIDDALNDPTRLNGSLTRSDDFFLLPNRESIIAASARLRRAARKQIPRARFYARLLAHLPFVRMVALTGALAMENASDNDIDFLIVTAPGRLWFVRGLSVALVRLARWRGDQLCPNFLLSENALAIPERNLYNAHEIAQMIPLYGFDVYRRMCLANTWAVTFLPNVDGVEALRPEKSLTRIGAACKRIAERALAGNLGERVEQWEMRRKVKKLSAQIPAQADGVEFSRDVCRGFFSGHSCRVLREFQERLVELQRTNYR